MSEHGTLIDYSTGEKLGPATAEQAATVGEGDTGTFRVDRDGNPIPEGLDESVYGPTKVVYVEQ